MDNDPCVMCGSDEIKTQIKEVAFNLPNPGVITVSQECGVCTECGETYYSEEQLSELSKKVEVEKSKI